MSNLRVFNIKTDKLNFDFSFNPDETFNCHEQLNYNPSLGMDDIRRVALWKLNRVINIPEDLLKNLSKLATNKSLHFSDETSRSIISALIECDGVGFPMASSILKFIRPDIYPIIDVRAYRALNGKKISYGQYSLNLYLDYIDEITKISTSLNIPLREVDEQLYCFDKTFNEKI
ncbi:hypothetical protein [Candidatus Methylopumilus turicensis]|uniref:Uncharacterized protein n=1 Tax=Candidatus Methylopumilus turicensis TaxID=1581680 RepID=A0A0B7IWR8_9PROT|nr:hypothetical protein [Candidatus Methylopumilus turicensis]CEN55522.1 conserved protein of unknown function [Candidatus Methylopumilus turicensis]